MKKLLSLLLLACMSVSLFAGCGGNNGNGGNSSQNSTSDSTHIETVDYVAETKLDMSSNSLKKEVTLKQHIDGDTSHFNCDLNFLENGVLKARYIAINTPESTGTIEPWGKKASNFTKTKLQSASSIIIETDGTEWETDSTGDRYLVWVWYKPQGSSEYRNLNLEILQEGLAVGNKAGQSRYGDICTQAINQARTLQLHCHSREKDPDFFYGDAIEIDLKELRTNPEAYNGKRVAFTGVSTVYHDWNVYVEAYDEITDRYYGISVFYGYNGQLHDPLKPGSLVRIVGKVSYYEAGGTYQISDLKFDLMDPENPNNVQNLGAGHEAAYAEFTIAQLNSQTQVEREELNIETGEYETVVKDYKVAELALCTSVSMKDLTVIDAYTTNNGGSNQGAISLTCKDANGNQIVVRTVPLMENGVLVTQDRYIGKTIDVKGLIDVYDGEYQVKVFWVGNIIIH